MKAGRMKILPLLFACFAGGAFAEDSAWVQLFNGKDLDDWVPKFEHQTLGVNQNNTFQAKNGMLDVILDQPYSKTGFGHLFYKKRPFSYYLLRLQFRFLSNTSAFNTGASGDPGGWTTQNNGAMLHSQAPATMTKDQKFPNSIEFQLIGPLGKVNNPPRNANVCVPGTLISYPLEKGSDYYDGNGHHCTDAKYHSLDYNKTLNNGTWIYSMGKVLADSEMVFYVRSRPDTAWDSVMGFSKIRAASSKAPLKEGYITIQAEGTSTEFKTIELLDLVGCMDKKSPNYRGYFVKNDAAACQATALAPPPAASGFRIAFSLGNLEVTMSGEFSVSALRLDGSLAGKVRGRGRASLEIPRDRPGLLLVRVENASGALIYKGVIPSL
jgi:hypothetical protein